MASGDTALLHWLQTRERPTSVREVAEQLEQSEALLAQSKLAQLGQFNQAYLKITQVVHDELQAGTFHDEDFLTQFDCTFAGYYFRPMLAYLLGEGTIPPAWRFAFDQAVQENVSPLFMLGLGVNAHINNDIVQVLAECQAQRRHYGDFKRVDGIIAATVGQALADLTPTPRPPLLGTQSLGPLKPLVTIGMDGLSRIWRRSAWNRYQRLQRGKLSLQGLEKTALGIAVEMNRLPL